MNRTVRRPVADWQASAPRMTSLISLIPDKTALKEMNWERVAPATMRASVVFPDPGGPQKIKECRRSSSMATRSGRPGPTTSS